MTKVIEIPWWFMLIHILVWFWVGWTCRIIHVRTRDYFKNKKKHLEEDDD